MQDERAGRGGDLLPGIGSPSRSGRAPEQGEPDTPRPPSEPPTASRSEPAVGPALSIAGAARGLGVATATLRSWERRYGLAPSLHTPGGHRRYGSDDLARLQVMHRLVRAGVPAAEAARVAIATQVARSADSSGPFAALLWDQRTDPGQPRPLEDPGEPRGASEGEPAVGSSGALAGAGLVEQPASGGGRVLSLPRRAGATARGLARSAMALDAPSCERILATSLAARGTVDTWEQLMRPVLGAIGRRWQSAQTGVEVEHTFSAVVCAALAGRSELRVRARNDSPVLLASVPDELHDLPLRALQAALAEQGIRSHLLGARTPADALADAMRRLGPPVVVLWAQMDIAALPALPAMRPPPAFIAAGPGLPSGVGAQLRAHSLAQAISQVRGALALDQPG